MRWKLLLIAAFLAALGGAGSVLGLFKLFEYVKFNASFLFFSLAAALLSAAAITYTSIFVYRHTARRRKLQAALTALFALTLTFALFVLLVQTKILPPLFRIA